MQPQQPNPVPPQQPQPNQPPAQPPKYDLSKIYPEAEDPTTARGIVRKLPSEIFSKFTFTNGWEIGTGIFVTSLIMGLVVGFFLYILFSVVHVHSLSSAIAVLLVSLGAALLIGIFVPYKIISNENIPDAFWLTLMGCSFGWIVNGLLGLSSIGLIGAYFSIHSYTSPISWLSIHLAKYTGSINSQLLSIIIIIISLIVALYFTKLIYGLTFFIAGKLKNELALKVLSLVLTVVIVGGSTILREVQVRNIKTRYSTSVFNQTGIR